MQVRTRDGRKFEGPDARAVVDAMAAIAMNGSRTRRGYMERAADRARKYNGVEIVLPDGDGEDACNAFLDGARAAGLILEVM